MLSSCTTVSCLVYPTGCSNASWEMTAPQTKTVRSNSHCLLSSQKDTSVPIYTGYDVSLHIHLTFMYVHGCKQKVFIGEKDLKSYVKADTYRLIRSWDLTEQTEQVLRDKKMNVAASLQSI